MNIQWLQNKWKWLLFFETSAPKEPKAFRQCLSDFIISGNHALNIVEEPEFVRMIRSLSSNITPLAIL
jgi:hypothetical protein